MHHVVAAYFLYKARVGLHHIGFGKQWVPVDILAELFFKFQVTHFVASGIVVEHTVKTDGLGRYHWRAHRHIGLKSARGAYAHNVEAAVCVFHNSLLEIDVGESIEFGHHDVDIVAPYAVAQCHNRPAAVGAAYGVELATAHFIVACVKVGCYHVDSARVTAYDDVVAQLVGVKVNVKYTAVGIDDHFRIGDYFLGHSCHCI